MSEELKTVLGLNEFRFIKGSLDSTPESVRNRWNFFPAYTGSLTILQRAD
jgi:hypothetical protein